MMLMVLEPPVQYDHAYHGTIIEQHLSSLQLVFLCHGFTSACSWVNKAGVCHIVISNAEKDSRVIALVRRHETGHCNGWPGHHPNGRWFDVKSGQETSAPKTARLNFRLF
jgi:hypothetical protein